MQIQSDSRISWVDMAKGWGILFVIYSHLCTGYLPSRWMFTFHIPLFFFLSGYVFNGNRPLRMFVLRKVRNLLIPYFALSIPMILFEGFFVRRADTTGLQWTLHLLLQTLIQRRQWTLWYLACLFWLNLLFYFLVKKTASFKKLFAVCLLLSAAGLTYACLGGPVLPWDLDACLTALPFFFAGYALKRFEPSVSGWMTGAKSVLLFVLAGALNLAAGSGSIFFGREGLNIFGSTYGFPPLTYLSAFGGILCVVLVSRWLTVKPISYLGRNSLLYFAWHQSPMMHLLFLFWQKMRIQVSDFSTPVILLIRLGELLALILVLTALNEAISRSRLRWILGKPLPAKERNR